MAYDKIIPIRSRLDQTVSYIRDRAKNSLAAALDYIGDSDKNTLGREALETAHRTDLIGFDKKCLIRPRRGESAGRDESGFGGRQRRDGSGIGTRQKAKKTIRNVHKKKKK